MQHGIMTMTDGERVVHSANLLDVSEYEVFRRSYLRWYGNDPEVAALEQDFVQYMYFGATPPWVRHFTRTLLGESPMASKPPRRGSFLVNALARLTDSRIGRFLMP